MYIKKIEEIKYSFKMLLQLDIEISIYIYAFYI